MFKNIRYYSAAGKISFTITLNSLQMFIRIMQDKLKLDNLFYQ